jgi:hypothetical protein
MVNFWTDSAGSGKQKEKVRRRENELEREAGDIDRCI